MQQRTPVVHIACSEQSNACTSAHNTRRHDCLGLHRTRWKRATCQRLLRLPGQHQNHPIKWPMDVIELDRKKGGWGGPFQNPGFGQLRRICYPVPILSTVQGSKFVAVSATPGFWKGPPHPPFLRSNYTSTEDLTVAALSRIFLYILDASLHSSCSASAVLSSSSNP